MINPMIQPNSLFALFPKEFHFRNFFPSSPKRKWEYQTKQKKSSSTEITNIRALCHHSLENEHTNQLQNQINNTSDPELKAELYLDLGYLYEYELTDLPAAKRQYVCALFEGRTRKSALIALARIYEKSHQWTELANVNRILLDEANDDDEKVICLLNMADIYRYQLNDGAQALDFYIRVLDYEPTNTEALANAAAIAHRINDSRHSHLEKLVELVSTPQ